MLRSRNRILVAAFAVSSLLACSGGSGTNDASGLPMNDTALFLTGTEQAPVFADGGKDASCTGKKQLVCHIPPGNPANAHTICVSVNAVETHQKHHGDPIGACPTPDAGTATPPVVTDPVDPVDPVDPGYDPGSADVVDAGEVNIP